MTSGQKIALSLLCTVLVFAGIVFASFAGGFARIETHFYQAAIVKDIHKQLSDVAAALKQYLKASQHRFYFGFASNAFVKSSFASEPNPEFVEARKTAAENLFMEAPELLGIRIIENNTQAILYTTFFNDGGIYETKDTDYDFSGTDPRITFDSEKGQIIYSFPCYGSSSVYQGLVLFYTAASDFTRYLISKNEILLTDPAVLIGGAERPGFIFGLPRIEKSVLADAVNIKWAGDSSRMEHIVESRSGDGWLLFTNTDVQGIKIGRVSSEGFFVFPRIVKLLLLICAFITIYLIIFLIFNIKQDDMLIIRERIKHFQLALINEYLITKSEVDWDAVCTAMAERKDDVTASIKKSLGSRGERHKTEVSALLDQSWNEILSVMGAQNTLMPSLAAKTETSSEQATKENLEELEAVDESLLMQEDTATFAKLEDFQVLPELSDLENLEDLEVKALKDLEEEMKMGEPLCSTVVPQEQQEDNSTKLFNFEPINPDFSMLDDEEDIQLAEIIEHVPYSLSLNLAYRPLLADIESVPQEKPVPIMEKDGLFIIPDNMELACSNLNQEFKTLVDSVLK